MGKLTTLPVAALETCDRTRVRYVKPKDGSDVVQEYAEAYRNRLIVEPLDVFCEKGTERYIVADGEHRLLALRVAKIKEVEVRLHEGSEVEALDFAIGCNHAHGVRRTKQDRYHAFVRIMETPLREKYRTDSDLSEKIGVHKHTITNYKIEWRNSEGGGKKAQSAKAEARDKAAKHAPKKAVAKVEEVEQEKGAKEPRAARPADKSPRPVPKEKQEDSSWTKADEVAAAAILDVVSELGKVWESATRAAQIHTRDVIRKALQGMH